MTTPRQPSAALLLTTVLAACSLSACVVVPDRPYYGGNSGYNNGDNYNDGPVVNVPPPAPQSEYVGPAPALGYVWITGFWAWRALGCPAPRLPLGAARLAT
jgi:hypothetical protein